MDSEHQRAITIFYDGKCNLCAREINHYQRVAPKGTFVYQDITESAEALELMGVSLLEGLKQLHVKDADGTLHVGLNASIVMWSQVKYFRLLAAIMRLPLVYSLGKLGYRAFAAWRFKRLTHCQIEQQRSSESQSRF